MHWYIIMLNILELLAVVTGFIFWKKIRNSYWRWFPVYLSLIFLTEMAGNYFLHVKQDLETNIAVYSYFGIPVQFLFFYWLFYQQFKSTKRHIWPLLAAVIYVICLVADLGYISTIKFYFQSFSYTIGCLFLLVLLIIYFDGFVRTDEIINYKTNMMFWVSLGILLFYIGTMPFFAFRKLLYKEYNDLFYVYWYIQFGLNYLMYLLFTLAFVWGRPK